VTTLTVDGFRALARSSPWLWRTLRFTLAFAHPQPYETGRLRAWVRRPRGLRIEEPNGRLIEAGWWPPPDQGMTPLSAGPEKRPDGLVARRPGEFGYPYRYDDPMFTNYRWVAMLHPFELADGVERDDDGNSGGLWSPEHSPIDFDYPSREVDHHGRPAWEATVVTTEHYAARCSCCPLLNGDEADRKLAAEGWDRTGVGRPTSWRIRLDRGTGVVVALTEIGGLQPNGGWTMRIEAVDEQMPRDLFGPDMTGGSGSATLYGVET